MRGLDHVRAAQHSGEIVSLTHDGDRHARRLEAEKLGLRPALGSGEALRLDVDERDGDGA